MGLDAIAALSAASFLTSLLTAALGIGGGLGLLSVMPSFIPMAAVVPLHGVTQLVSNASRFAFDHRHADIRLLPPYLGGACIGGGTATSSWARCPISVYRLCSAGSSCSAPGPIW
jgi:hypothetical protein